MSHDHDPEAYDRDARVAAISDSTERSYTATVDRLQMERVRNIPHVPLMHDQTFERRNFAAASVTWAQEARAARRDRRRLLKPARVTW